MTTIASDIELEPLPDLPAGGRPLVTSALPFLGAVSVHVDVLVGSAQTDLARLLAMQQGAVLALDRLLEHPVDVRVGEHVVARGVLVAVDEHFGVRITETASLSDAASAQDDLPS